jgi:YidC/Oxa1 family membrane protein insertase
MFAALKNQPSQGTNKNNFWSTLLIFMAIYVGLNAFCNHPNTGDHRTPAKTSQDIQDQAALIDKTTADQHISVRAAISELRNRSVDAIPDLLIAHDSMSAEQDLEQMRILNRFLCDTSISSIQSAYETQVRNEKGLSNQAKDDLVLQAQLLVDDTGLKASADRKDINRLAQANDNITRLARYNDKKPIWQQPITVAPSRRFQATVVTPEQLTSEINTLSTEIGKNTLVFGFFPGYQFVNFFVQLTGGSAGFSYWFAALMLAFIVRGTVFPIAQRQMMWSRQMQQLTPLVNEIKEEYKGKVDSASTAEQQQRTMALYKEYGLNPFSGCLPALVQWPLFLLIYDSMLNYRVQFKGGTFLWINPATSALSHGFLARNLGEKDYILCCIYAISMVTTALLAPVSDPQNMKQQRMMGIGASAFFGILMFFWPVPSAFVLYWIFTNTLATAQSYRANRLPLPPLVKKNAPNGGVFPSGGSIFGPTKEGAPSNGSTNGQLNGKPKSTGSPRVQKPKKKK